MKKIGQGFVLMIMLASLFVAQLFHQNLQYSSKENRMLNQKPTISLNEVASGDYQTNYENYLNDQFVNRTTLTSLKNKLNYLLGVSKVDDVYIGSEGMLIQAFNGVSNKQLQADVKAVNNFKNKYKNKKMSFIMVPNKVNIYKDRLPKNTTTKNQQETINKFYQGLDKDIVKVDATNVLKKHSNEYIYYNTDHHWTSKAAKYVFDEWLNKNGTENVVKYKKYVSNDDFIGSLANKIAFYSKKDQVDIYKALDNIKVVVNYDDNDYASMYDYSKQLSSDPYGVFLGGNHAKLEIKTTANNKKHILVFKDSFANCFIPFLASYYSKITVIDPRYYYDDIDALIKSNNVDEVLFLYNANTYFGDTSLNDLLG